MAYRAGVVGGSGYTGAELLRLLAGHPEIEVVHVTADSNAGAAVGDLYPGLLPAYEQLLKAAHTFNLLDARGAISVTERAAYILRVRALAKGCCEAWLANAPPAEPLIPA